MMGSRFNGELAVAVIVATTVIQSGADGQPAQGTPGANNGTVYVSRPSKYAASLLSVSVNVDGKSVGRISDGGCIAVKLPPGRHTISGSDMWDGLLSSSGDTAQVDVRPGSSTYVQITPTIILPFSYLIYPASTMANGRRC